MSTLSAVVSQWRTSMQARNIAPRTIDQYGYALDCVISVIGPDIMVTAITPSHVEQVVVALHNRGWKAASVSSCYRPWRTLMNWCVSRGNARALMAAADLGSINQLDHRRGLVRVRHQGHSKVID
jgi:site-specific recombinase XerC